MKMKRFFYSTFMPVMFASVFISCDKENKDEPQNSPENNNLKTGQIELLANPDKNNTISFTATAQKITIDWGDGCIEDINPIGIRAEYIHVYENPNLKKITINTERLSSFSDSYYANGSTNPPKGVYHELTFGECTELLSVHIRNYTDGKLRKLEIKNAPRLASLTVNSSTLTSLNVNPYTELKSLTLWTYRMASLDISQCFNLEYLNIDMYELTSLNMGQYPKLKSLIVNAYPLSIPLNMSQSAYLEHVEIKMQNLTSLDISQCPKLKYLDIRYINANVFNVEVLNSLFNSLPIRQMTDYATIRYSSNIYGEDKSIYENKGWTRGNN